MPKPKVSCTVRVHNQENTPRKLIVEPWGLEVPMPPGSSCKLQGRGPGAPGEVEFWTDGDAFMVSFPYDLRVWRDGVELPT